MAIDYDKLMNRKFERLEHTYTEKDTILYALGVGMGSRPRARRGPRPRSFTSPA